MLSRWVSFGQGHGGLVIHRHPTPSDGPTSYPVLDKSDPDPLPDWPQIKPEQTARLYTKFVETFFSTRVPDTGGRGSRMPFLSTYRDFDIVEDLFLQTIAGEFKPPPQKIEEMHQALMERFVRLRIARNVLPHSGPSDENRDALVQRIIERGHKGASCKIPGEGHLESRLTACP